MALNKIIVGISDMAVSRSCEDILITYSLGSCLGVSAHDAKAGVGGMIHCMLPLASVDEDKARTTPAMFVETGIPLLLNAMFEAGATKENLILKAAGCAQLMDPNGHFKIGERNYTIFRKILWKNGILIRASTVGGMVSRTLTLEIGSGKTTVKSQGTEVDL